jgi:hypothetical protein
MLGRNLSGSDQNHFRVGKILQPHHTAVAALETDYGEDCEDWRDPSAAITSATSLETPSMSY